MDELSRQRHLTPKRRMERKRMIKSRRRKIYRPEWVSPETNIFDIKVVTAPPPVDTVFYVKYLGGRPRAHHQLWGLDLGRKTFIFRCTVEESRHYSPKEWC